MDPGLADGGGNAELLNTLLGAEHQMVAAYTAGMPLLDGAALINAQHILEQEHEHIERLRALISGAGANPVGPLGSYDFNTPANQAEMLRELMRVERQGIAIYGELVPRIPDPQLRMLAASIATAEAEHDSLLLARLGRWPAPTAFVTGRS
ncbi:MAG TPA: DUF4439 domain-containing protein [Conexibacter sp.]